MLSPAAIHLGILAACVVLFVPMFLAGVHLSRNKMLFFSCSLFISLAVVVHVSPYLPSLLPSPAARPAPTPLSCLSSLHRSTATCRLHRFSRVDTLDLLNGSSVAVAGDSQCRLFTLSLLSLLLDPAAVDDVRSDLFKRHSDYQIQIHDRSIKIDFVWSPFESNISSFIRSIEGSASSSPDVIVAGSGLWHMLHVTDPADYGGKLSDIKKEASKAGILEHAFWLGLPELVETMLNTEEKRSNMNRTMQESYRAELGKSGILKREGGQFLLIDVGFLSRERGAKCTEDGMHCDQRVYDAAVQVMLNALLIESQQRVV